MSIHPNPNTQQFLEALSAKNFSGEIEVSYAQRLMAATDNSIYQLMPEAILFPKDNHDVEKVMSLLGEEQFRQITLSTRGGGTGTNGQSLNSGLILDLSRHMNKILHFDADRRVVTVQTGLLKISSMPIFAPMAISLRLNFQLLIVPLLGDDQY